MGAQILIIEDNEANCELMQYLLRAYGHTVVTAPDAPSGLARARRLRPDLILCDIQLPGMDGAQLARLIRADSKLDGMALLAVTALAMVGDRETILAAGFDGYFSKPIVPATFVQELQAYLPERLHGSRSAVCAAPLTAPQAPARHHATILVIDDRAENLHLARSLFGSSGYLVRTASGVLGALLELRRCVPDVILSDIAMTDGSGFDLIRRVKADQQLQPIPFIFITSTMTTEGDRRKGLALGAEHFLIRPIDPRQLLAVVSGCLHKPA